METFTFNTVELILLSVAGILFIIQLIYYFGLYNRIHVHNKAVGKEEVHFIRELPPLSVILCARNEAENLRKILPALAAERAYFALRPRFSVFRRIHGKGFREKISVFGVVPHTRIETEILHAVHAHCRKRGHRAQIDLKGEIDRR